MAKLPRGIRNKNPGNVRRTRDAWQGEIEPGTDKAFMQFDTMSNGVRCTAKILLGYRLKGLMTVREMVSRWAPPTENDTESYIANVSAQMDVAHDEVFAMTPDKLSAMCQAIFLHENGGDFVSREDRRSGVLAAMGA